MGPPCEANSGCRRTRRAPVSMSGSRCRPAIGVDRPWDHGIRRRPGHGLRPAAAGALEVLERPVAVELDGTLTRGATVVDWNRQQGRPDNASLLMRYDQPRFEGLIRAALAAK